MGNKDSWAGSQSQSKALMTPCGNHAFFLLAFRGKKAEDFIMTTAIRPSGWSGWSIRCASVAISLAFCASAFAGASSAVSEPQKVQSTTKKVHKLCYARVTASGIPLPCERIAGLAPTTISPMEIIGHSR